MAIDIITITQNNFAYLRKSFRKASETLIGMNLIIFVGNY